MQIRCIANVNHTLSAVQPLILMQSCCFMLCMTGRLIAGPHTKSFIIGAIRWLHLSGVSSSSGSHLPFVLGYILREWLEQTFWSPFNAA